MLVSQHLKVRLLWVSASSFNRTLRRCYETNSLVFNYVCANWPLPCHYPERGDLVCRQFFPQRWRPFCQLVVLTFGCNLAADQLFSSCSQSPSHLSPEFICQTWTNDQELQKFACVEALFILRRREVDVNHFCNSIPSLTCVFGSVFEVSER